MSWQEVVMLGISLNEGYNLPSFR